MSEEAIEPRRASVIVWIDIGVAYRTADTVDAIHTIRTSSRGAIRVATDFREADATDTLMSRRAISLVGTDRIAIAEEAIEPRRASVIVWIGTDVAYRTACTINTFHPSRTGFVSITTDSKFWEADTAEADMSFWAVSIFRANWIAVSKEALGAFWAGVGIGVRITYPTACTINTFKAGGTISVVVTA